jgi:hypothetical protein
MSGNLPDIVACAAPLLGRSTLVSRLVHLFRIIAAARATLFHFTAVFSRSALRLLDALRSEPPCWVLPFSL